VPLEIRVKLFVVALEHVTMKPVFVTVDTGEICVKIISVLESVSSVLATETVIQLLENYHRYSYHHYTLHVLHRGNHNLSQHNMVHIHR
jgi:hypothetical protein